MEDKRIIELYFARNEQAIAETDRNYGSYCRAIAYRILEEEANALEEEKQKQAQEVPV